ncbi:MAG TPA: hypothetical protein VN726_22890 [Hanamia sp.]|nr:hypothetical protein [Hanamia sp.]
MTNTIKLILCLLFIFGGVTIACLGHIVAGIAGVVIGIGIAASTYKK